MDRGAWRATVHGVTNSHDLPTKQQHPYLYIETNKYIFEIMQYKMF